MVPATGVLFLSMLYERHLRLLVDGPFQWCLSLELGVGVVILFDTTVDVIDDNVDSRFHVR